MRAKPRLTLRRFYVHTKKNNIKSNIGPLVNENDVLIQDSGQMAEILNTNFASVFTTENLDTVPECPAPPIEITPLELDKIAKVPRQTLSQQVNRTR